MAILVCERLYLLRVLGDLCTVIFRLLQVENESRQTHELTNCEQTVKSIVFFAEMWYISVRNRNI